MTRLLVLLTFMGLLLAPITAEAADRATWKWSGIAQISVGAFLVVDALGGSEDFAHPEREEPRLWKGLTGAALMTTGIVFVVKSRAVTVAASPSRVSVSLRW